MVFTNDKGDVLHDIKDVYGVHCYSHLCSKCDFHKKTGYTEDCEAWAISDPEETARLMGWEVVEDGKKDIRDHTLRELVETCQKVADAWVRGEVDNCREGCIYGKVCEEYWDDLYPCEWEDFSTDPKEAYTRIKTVRTEGETPMAERRIIPGVYKHFKGKKCHVLDIAQHSETEERLVVYRTMDDDQKLYARPYEMFASEVDHDKYPDVTQKYRFEHVEKDSMPIADSWTVGEVVRKCNAELDKFDINCKKNCPWVNVCDENWDDHPPADWFDINDDDVPEPEEPDSVKEFRAEADAILEYIKSVQEEEELEAYRQLFRQSGPSGMVPFLEVELNQLKEMTKRNVLVRPKIRIQLTRLAALGTLTAVLLESNGEDVDIKVEAERVLNELADLYRRKNHDYGDSFHQTFLEDGWAMVRVRLSDKVNRFAQLAKTGVQMVQDEKMVDSIRDSVAYEIMSLMEMDRED